MSDCLLVLQAQGQIDIKSIYLHGYTTINLLELILFLSVRRNERSHIQSIRVHFKQVYDVYDHTDLDGFLGYMVAIRQSSLSPFELMDNVFGQYVKKICIGSHAHVKTMITTDTNILNEWNEKKEMMMISPGEIIQILLQRYTRFTHIETILFHYG